MSSKSHVKVPPHLKYVAALPWEMLDIHFHAVLQKMMLKSLSCVLKIMCFMTYGWIDIDTVTSVACIVSYMPQTCLEMPTPLINCTANNALVSATEPRTTTADKLSAGWHPINCSGQDWVPRSEIWSSESGVACSKRRTVTKCSLYRRRSCQH